MNYEPKKLHTGDLEPRPILADISVVIPTIGRLILEESLYWIAAGTAWPNSLIVVDQGRNSQVAGWIEVLQSLGIAALYIPSIGRGKAAGLNCGIERVSTRFFAVTDDDCFVDANWLLNMTVCLKNNPEAIVTGPAVAAGDEFVGATVPVRAPAIYRRPSLKADLFCGSNLGAATVIIEKVGYFDEDPRLIVAEDCEWSYRALRSGVPILYTPEVRVRHYGWRNDEQRAAQYYAYAQSHGSFYGKYIREGDWFIAIRALLHYTRALRRLLRGIVTNDVERKVRGRAYLSGLLTGILAGMGKDWPQ